jgi:hypothetical protein
MGLHGKQQEHRKAELLRIHMCFLLSYLLLQDEERGRAQLVLAQIADAALRLLCGLDNDMLQSAAGGANSNVVLGVDAAEVAESVGREENIEQERSGYQARKTGDKHRDHREGKGGKQHISNALLAYLP